ncbi:trimeric intracellular cation channel family protein [Neisseria sp. Ec49-e6-T10]|uniref:trimeric intracellular cation channel family protein n=1 Tax=Neisseria sp. Ec49-e6-T10 TaxID=3140744 RepID=UPI003EB9A3A9
MYTLTLLNEIKLFNIIEIAGTIAFAISGIRLAASKHFDWFGALVVGYATAIGGGTLRDLLLGITPFWMLSSLYLWCTIAALAFVIIFRRFLAKLDNTFFWFDGIGLGLFVVVGVEKAMAFGYTTWISVFMGTITGIVGGIIRDIMINEVPIVFTQELYAIACIIGGCIFCLLHYFGVITPINELITALSVFVIRLLTTKYKLRLPTLT